MEQVFARLERWLEPLLAALLAFITLGVFIQVVLRYLFATSFLWGEELSLFAFIWCVFLGSRGLLLAAHPFFVRYLLRAPDRPHGGRAAAGRGPVVLAVTVTMAFTAGSSRC